MVRVVPGQGGVGCRGLQDTILAWPDPSPVVAVRPGMPIHKKMSQMSRRPPSQVAAPEPFATLVSRPRATAGRTGGGIRAGGRGCGAAGPPNMPGMDGWVDTTDTARLSDCGRMESEMVRSRTGRAPGAAGSAVTSGWMEPTYIQEPTEVQNYNGILTRGLQSPPPAPATIQSQPPGPPGPPATSHQPPHTRHQTTTDQ